jgi:hypothetical protein
MKPSPLIVLPPTPPAFLRRRAALTLFFFLLGLVYLTLTPIFEISDEVSHYPVVDYIADHAALPVQDKRRLNEWDWEAAQPPLYYVLAALIVAPFQRDDMENFLSDNPHAKVGIGLATDNHNFVLHDWQAEAFPWRGTPLHVRFVRLFSLLLGAGAVWLTFTVTRLLFPLRAGVALVATGISAFNPMFIAISASVNNDTLVNFLTPLGLALALTLWRAGWSWWRVGALALVATLAAASKLSGTFLFITGGLTVVAVVWRDKLPPRRVLLAGLIFVGLWATLFGWWYVRNWTLYADPLGNRHMAETVGLRETPIGLLDLVREESFSFFAAYWGWFGAVNILAPLGLFYVGGALWLLGVAGLPRLGLALWRGRAAGWPILFPHGLMALLVALAVASFLAWTLQTPASQGRLLFPFMVIFSAYCADGLLRWLGRAGAACALAALGLFALFCGAWLIPHAFRLPPKLAALPAATRPVDVTYGESVELLGYQIDARPLVAGEAHQTLAVTLYWRPRQASPTPWSLYIQLYGPSNGQVVEIGKVDSYPGRGLLRSDTWALGTIYADTYRVELRFDKAPHLDLPFQPRLKIGWRDAARAQEISATDGAGRLLDAVTLNGGRIRHDVGRFGGAVQAEFGGILALHQAEARQTVNGINVAVYWSALRPVTEDFTVFAQLVAKSDLTQPLAFGDSPPRAGWWPTSQWLVGDVFYDSYFLPYTAEATGGDYAILIGFYRPSDLTRLPLNTQTYRDFVLLDIDGAE